ncbi:MAG TPA: DUF3052 domain-containing protein [Solirubrobacteraceae bacterium]
MAAAGYSATPLPRKLGFKPGMTAVFLDAPEHVGDLLGELEGVTVKRSLRGHADLVMCFVTRRRELKRRAPRLREAVAPDGMVWVCWPKRASKVDTDVTEDVVREVLLPTGLVDNKVAAVDETWSGLKLVVRVELR